MEWNLSKQEPYGKEHSKQNLQLYLISLTHTHISLCAAQILNYLSGHSNFFWCVLKPFPFSMLYTYPNSVYCTILTYILLL
jgi:hypothetical protein